MDVGEPGGWGNPLSRGRKIARVHIQSHNLGMPGWSFSSLSGFGILLSQKCDDRSLSADITSWWRWSRAARWRNSRNRSFFQWPIYSPSLKSSLFLNVACIESHLQPCVTSQAESLYQRLSGSTSSLLWRLWSSFKAAPRIITVRLVR